MIKVQGGTRSQNAQILCQSCRSATIVKGPAESQQIIKCHELNMVVPFDVVECKSYDDKSQPTKHDFYQTAWILETKKAGREIGFKPYKEWKNDNKNDYSEFD